jgi:dienelactone hydrolase
MRQRLCFSALFLGCLLGSLVAGAGTAGAQPLFPAIGSLPAVNYLPDPFLMRSGVRIADRAAWQAQRRYLLDMLQFYEYGRMPPAPGNVKGTVTSHVISADKRTVSQKVRIVCGPGDGVAFTFSLARPNQAGPFPVIIAIGGSHAANMRIDGALAGGASKGYMMVAFEEESLVGDNVDLKTALPAYASYDWGTLAAWAWGTQRIVDYLEGRPEADKQRMAITGHSRYGKAAIWAGAYDDRFTLVAANHSGTGGAESGKFGKGETVLQVATHFKFWFQADGRYAECGAAGNIARMPFDGHFLKAAVAPRNLLVLEGTQDPIVNAWGSAQTSYAAERVYAYVGAAGKLKTHYCACQHIFDWDGLFAYTDHAWFGKAFPTGYDALNNRYPEEAKLIPWEAPVATALRTAAKQAAVSARLPQRGFRADGRSGMRARSGAILPGR